MSRGQNELISKFKMAVGDVICIRGLVMEYIYIPTGIKRGDVNCDWNGSGLFEEDWWPFILVDRLFLVSA